MSQVVLNPPKNISPLIRLGRWAFFLGGVYYGYNKLQTLRVHDEPLRKAAIEKATRDHHKHVEDLKKLNEENMLQLAAAAGVKVKN